MYILVLVCILVRTVTTACLFFASFECVTSETNPFRPVRYSVTSGLVYTGLLRDFMIMCLRLHDIRIIVFFT